jgi:hypothetical protein
MTPTQRTYERLNEAYAYFNDRLFSGRLPSCLITMQRKNGIYGYFAEGCGQNQLVGASTQRLTINCLLAVDV